MRPYGTAALSDTERSRDGRDISRRRHGLIGSAKGLLYRGVNEIVDITRIEKSDLGFARVNVYVDGGARKFKVQRIGSVPAFLHLVVVGHADRVGDMPVAHNAPIDRNILQIGVLAAIPRIADPSAYRQFTGSDIQAAGVFHKFSAE